MPGRRPLNDIGDILDNAGIKHLPVPNVEAEQIEKPVTRQQKPESVPNPSLKKSRGSTQKRTNGPAPVPDSATTKRAVCAYYSRPRYWRETG